MNDHDEREGVVAVLRTRFQDQAITAECLQLLQRGNYGNANVYRYADEKRDIIVKEFLSRSWWIRATMGRFYAHREVKALTDLKNNPGIPENPCRLGAHAFCYDYIQGEALSTLTKGSTKIPKTFFIELERRVKQLHASGFAHLDVRNLGNIVQAKDGQPYLIDFQSCVGTRHFPRKILMIVEDADYSGVYKSWKKLCEEPLDTKRAAFLAMVNHRRKLWIFKGYALKKAARRRKNI